MAKLVLSPTYSAITGSIGGVTFQKNASGLIARNRPTGQKSKSIKQSIVRQQPNDINYLWQITTLSQKGQWNDFAFTYDKINKYGQTKKLTGFNWFSSINTNLAIIGQPTIQIPPSHTTPPAVPTFTITLSNTEILITLNASIVETETYLIFNASPTIRPSISMVPRQLRLISVKTSNINVPTNLISDWEAYFNQSWATLFSTTTFNIAISVESINFVTGLRSTGQFNIQSN